MKSVLKFIKIAAIATVSAALLLIIFINIIDIPGEKKEKLFRKIKPGMSVDQVVSILGQPDTIIRDDSVRFMYEYSSKILGKSTEPQVIFDTSHKVISAVYGD